MVKNPSADWKYIHRKDSLVELKSVDLRDITQTKVLKYIRNLLSHHNTVSDRIYDRCVPDNSYCVWSMLPKLFNADYDEIVQTAWILPEDMSPIDPKSVDIQGELFKSQVDHSRYVDDSVRHSLCDDEYTHNVDRVEIINHDEPIELYDMVVEEHHNYAVSVGDGSCVFSKNTFSILYGKSIYSFGMDFLNGDVTAAQEIFDGFYSAFPKIKDFIDDRHNDVMTRGYVETYYGDRLYIDYSESMSKGEKGKALREAVNAPIQSSASTLAALGIYHTARDMYQKNVPLSVYCFQHDAGGYDTRCQWIKEVLRSVKLNMDVNVREKFGLPVAVDFEVGVTGGAMVELGLKSDVYDDVLEFGVSGTQTNLDSLRSVLDVGEVDYSIEITDSSSKYVSMTDLYTNGKGYAMNYGSTIVNQEGKLILR